MKNYKMKKIWIHKAKSFKDAEEFDRKYYAEMTPEERLSIVQELREMYLKFPSSKRTVKHESRKGLRRVIKIVQ